MQITGTITDKDEIYIYFEMLKRMQPKSVLDIGMFLKRIGAISRQAVSMRIPEEVFLYGIDFFSEVRLPVYEKVYNGILSKDLFFENCEVLVGTEEEKFDMAVLLHIEEYLNPNELRQLGEVIAHLAKGVLTDEKIGKQLMLYGVPQEYQTLAVGENRYLWIPFAKMGGRE